MQDGEVIYTTMGKFCSIVSHYRINPGNHPLERTSSHHFTYRASQYLMGEDEAEFFAWRKSFPVTIGHDVWLAHGVVVLPGVTIGTGSAIGAGAIVTKDVPPYSIVVGVPGKVLRPGFDEATQQRLMDLAWWDWPHERMSQALHDFRNLSAQDFVSKYR